MGLCCSIEVVDDDTFKRSYPSELTPEVHAYIEEDVLEDNEAAQEAQVDAAPRPSEEARCIPDDVARAVGGLSVAQALAQVVWIDSQARSMSLPMRFMRSTPHL